MASIEIRIEPGCLPLPAAAAFVGLSETTWQELVARREAPQPRQLSGRRTGWLVDELREWLRNRPVSTLPPPPNTSAKKPRAPTPPRSA